MTLIASADGRNGSVTVHQDVAIYATTLSPGKHVTLALAPGRHTWVQVASGSLELNGTRLGEGDGAALSDETNLELHGTSEAEVLVFDLA